MNPMTVDKQLLDMMISIHSEFPVLNESDLISIIDLLKSEDPEVQVTGIGILSTFNFFKTPETLKALYSNCNVSIDIDELDQFAMMIRLNYANSKNNKLTDKEIANDKKLEELCQNIFQIKK